MPNFVYTIALGSGNTRIEGIPVFGFAPVDQDPGNPYYRAQSAHDVRNIVWQADGARGLTLAVPYPEVYKFFNPKTQYETLTIFPNDKPDEQFNTIGDTYTFESIVVGASTPMDFGTFKVSPRELQWIYSFGVKNLKNKYGTDVPGVIAMVRPFAVKVGFDQLR
jgi:hypothetical protein